MDYVYRRNFKLSLLYIQYLQEQAQVIRYQKRNNYVSKSNYFF